MNPQLELLRADVRKLERDLKANDRALLLVALLNALSFIVVIFFL